MKNIRVSKTFWLMLFIVALGIVLRLIFIDKPDGLWNDEYVSWFVASFPLGKEFVNAIAAQCHMPFYYLYLKFFIHFYGNSDLMLRLTSVLPGVLSIFVMYFVGKEMGDEETGEKLGILCAALTALSSFNIYFSQEVRFYAILFLFSALSLLFTIKLEKKQNLLNLLCYMISNFLIIFTHTIGFLFVLFNLIFLSFWILKNDDKHKKTIYVTWSVLLFLTLLDVPLLFKILTTHQNSQWWGSFCFSKIGFLFTDYFSPILTNIVSAPDSFFYDFTLKFIIFALAPSIIAIIGIVKALLARKYEINGLFFVAFAFIITLVLAAISGKLVFITKYSIEIYPILLLIMCFGLLEFKKGWRYFLIFAFCFLNLFYVLTNPNSAPRLHRSEGHKIAANLIKNANLKKDDIILFNYYAQDRFGKYFDFSPYRVISVNKVNFADFLGVTSKDDFKKIDNKFFNAKFKKEITDKLLPNQQLAVVILNDVSTYSPTEMQFLFNNDKEYQKAPFLFLVFSYLKNKELDEALKSLKILRIEQKGSWTVVTFQKQ